MKKNELDRLNDKIQQKSSFVDELRNEISNVIVGQHDLIDKILISLEHPIWQYEFMKFTLHVDSSFIMVFISFFYDWANFIFWNKFYTAKT